ncbi:MAG: sensor histidine kinase [Tannerellaceae bacterium]
MDSFVAYTIRKLPLVSFISALFIIYPNIVCIPWEWQMLPGTTEAIVYSLFFCFRFAYLWALFYCLIRYNLGKASLLNLKKRFMHNFAISMGAYLIYLVFYWFAKSYGAHDCFGSILIFQFFVVCAICTLIGQLALLYTAQQEKELEIERLKTENLQSRCNALMNQINPHFFFNSLSGISSLIRKKDDTKTLDYVDKLSDIFRYILQSDRKGLVPLREELDFIEAFRYVMEVRFANKLTFDIQISDRDKDQYTLPALSLLPLVDNIVVHNIIDIDHKMVISISLNEKGELVVSNPVYPKTCKPKTNGTGLKNIENRFILLTNRKIKVEQDEYSFKVYLPLR